MDADARVREIIERFNARGAESILEDTTPDVRAIPFSEWPGDPLYEGHDGFLKLVAEWTENFDDYSWQIEEVRESPEGVVILARHGGRTKGDGIWVEQPVGAVWQFRGDLVAEMHYFLTWDEALAQ